MVFKGIAFRSPWVGLLLDGEQAVCALAPLRCAQNVAHRAHGLLTVLRGVASLARGSARFDLACHSECQLRRLSPEYLAAPAFVHQPLGCTAGNDQGRIRSHFSVHTPQNQAASQDGCAYNTAHQGLLHQAPTGQGQPPACAQAGQQHAKQGNAPCRGNEVKSVNDLF